MLFHSSSPDSHISSSYSSHHNYSTLLVPSHRIKRRNSETQIFTYQDCSREILGCRKEGAKTKPKEMKNDIENNTKTPQIWGRSFRKRLAQFEREAYRKQRGKPATTGQCKQVRRDNNDNAIAIGLIRHFPRKPFELFGLRTPRPHMRSRFRCLALVQQKNIPPFNFDIPYEVSIQMLSSCPTKEKTSPHSIWGFNSGA